MRPTLFIPGQEEPSSRRTVTLLPFLQWLFVGLIAVVLVLLPVTLGALLVVGGALALLVLVRPVVALIVLPFAVPFGSIADVPIGPAQVGGTEVLLALFFAAYLARGIARRQLHLTSPPLLLPFALWLGVQAASTLGALSLAASAKELIKWGEMAALLVVASHELRRRDIPLVVAAILLAGAVAGAHGVVQSVGRIGPAGFLFPLAGRVWLRAYGTFAQPNPYAGYLGLTLPLAYGVAAVLLGLGAAPWNAWASRQGGVPRVPRRAILGFLLVTGGLIALGLFLSLSRGAWIGATLAAMTVGTLLSRRALVASIVAGTAGALFLALGGGQQLPPVLRERATDFLPYLGMVDIRGITVTPANFAVIERLAHWFAALEMWADHPWLGVGIGNYPVVYPAYALPFWQDPLGHAHNFYLNVAAETGLVGLAAYLLLWSTVMIYTLRTVRVTAGLDRGIAVGCLGAFVHLAVHNVFDNLYVHGIYLLVALLLAVVVILARTETDEEQTRLA